MLLLPRYRATAALRPLVASIRAQPPCSACSASPFSSSSAATGGGVVLGCGSNVLGVISRVRALPQAGEKGYFADPEVLVSAQIVGGLR